MELDAFAAVVGGQLEDVGTAGHVLSAGVTPTADQPAGTDGIVTEYVAPGVLALAFAHWSRTAFFVASAALRRTASACAAER